MTQQKTLYIFDLDDTLIPTYKFDPEYRVGNYKNLNFFNNVKQMLISIPKQECILLTYDKYGDQHKKLAHLNVKNYFSQVFVVDDKSKKKEVMKSLMDGYSTLIVIGDRYENGELCYALDLGLKTVCVSMDGFKFKDETHHHRYDLIVKSEHDFIKILDLKV